MNDAQLYENAQKMLQVLDEGGIGVIREIGIKGWKGEAMACLVARYLNQTVGGAWSVGPDWTSAVFDRPDGGGRFHGDSVRLPLNVRRLVHDFDLGLYPDLEEET